MIPLPLYLEPFRSSATRLIDEGHILAIEFSGRTYQVNVYDPQAKESYWVFLHLTKQGEISDYFCLCSDETEADHCVHLAAGFLQIYNHKSEPLHVRYEISFWRSLGMLLDRKYGKNPKGIIQAKNKKGEVYLKELFEKNIAPTEENSLKFSDLTEQELKQVRSGKVTPKLHYEFSFWSDFAKNLLLLQEKGDPARLTFTENEEGLPLHLKLETSLLTLELPLEKEELAELIPSLLTIKSPLRVGGGFKDRIKDIRFDAEKGALILDKSAFDPSKIEGKAMDGWIYQSQKGFYSTRPDPRLELAEIPKDQVEMFLTHYQSKLEKLITPGIFEWKAELKFDNKKRLKISHYLMEPGDTSKEDSWSFGPWTWLPEVGFVKTMMPKHLPPAGIIKTENVYDWVITHQTFLNGVQGFKVHLRTVESSLTYKVDDEGFLTFFSTLKGEFRDTPQEFGALLYVKEQGFYSKSSLQDNVAVQAGNKISPLQVASYIRRNESELKYVPNFFLKKTPLEKAGIKLDLVNDRIVGKPVIELIREYEHKRSRLYEEYLYIEGEGFFRLNEKQFLPYDWREERVVKPSEFSDFFSKTYQKLEPYLVDVDPQLMNPKSLKVVYDNSLFFEAGGQRIPFKSFLDAYKSKKRFYFSPLGRIDLNEKRFEMIGDIFKTGKYPDISLLEMFKLNALEDIQVNLEQFKKSRPLDLSGLTSTLRPYQEIGVKWLWSLYCNDLSALLCDDMGLGKTHQAMALLCAIQNEAKKPLKFLVVCPTSVLYHWHEKLAQFLPDMKSHMFHGLNRSLEGYTEGVLLTSYGILRNEIDLLKKFDFEVVIFDEMQLAKNHLSRLWNSLKTIQSKMVLGLTGTPIENHLRELKSLFDIVLPTLMPSDNDFIRLFVRPIEREESKAAKALLHRFIEPFLLRRKKEEVLFDLPEKTEEIAHTELAPSQKRLYQEVFEGARHSVIHELMDDQKIIPYIHIFALLSSLKKICDHPALYMKNVENYQKYHSGKWELFKELLNEAMASEQKVVVFSHFLGMLDIIEAYLTEEGIGFASLRGSTPNRREMIARFQKEPECKVFVASLQAGGLGIDLTSASVVIHYDRWWNAARENQATDRVHRIGQTRGVQVFKLVTLGTVEERIDKLIEKKRKMMEEIVGADEAQVLKMLSRDELIQIFQEEPE